jgi:hypothetical protein
MTWRPATRPFKGYRADRHSFDGKSDDSKGSTLDPDTVAQEHHSFFFPDNGHGAANAAGFGWRNGG